MIRYLLIAAFLCVAAAPDVGAASGKRVYLQHENSSAYWHQKYAKRFSPKNRMSRTADETKTIESQMNEAGARAEHAQQAGTQQMKCGIAGAFPGTSKVFGC